MISHNCLSEIKCDICCKRLQNQTALAGHKCYQICGICDKGFTNFIDYDTHIRAKHNVGLTLFNHAGGINNLIINYKCLLCFYYSGSLNELKQHRECHKVTCSTCKVTFDDKTSLNLHRKNYMCPLCTHVFCCSDELEQHHSLAHTAKKSFVLLIFENCTRKNTN